MSETSNEVLVERLDNFKEYMKDATEKGFQGIHRRLDDLDENQKKTNGNVKRLQVWKASLAAALSVTVFVASYALRDYFAFKTSYYQSEKSNAVIVEKLNQQEKALKEMKDYLAKYNIRIEN